MLESEKKLELLPKYLSFVSDILFQARTDFYHLKYEIEGFDEWIEQNNNEKNISFVTQQITICLLDTKEGTMIVKNKMELLPATPTQQGVIIPLFTKTYKTYRYTGIEHSISYIKTNYSSNEFFKRYPNKKKTVTEWIKNNTRINDIKKYNLTDM